MMFKMLDIDGKVLNGVNPLKVPILVMTSCFCDSSERFLSFHLWGGQN